MSRSEKKKTYVIAGIFLLVSLVVFATLVFWTHHRDLQKTYAQAQKTVSFLETECEKFDNYNQGNSARALQDLLDSANGLKTFVPVQKIQDGDFLKEYIHAEHVSGVLVLDASFSKIAQADMDDKDSYSIWKDTLKKSGIQNITEYPEKTYSGVRALSGKRGVCGSEKSDRGRIYDIPCMLYGYSFDPVVFG